MANQNTSAPLTNMSEGEATSPHAREAALLLAILGRSVPTTEPGRTVTAIEPPTGDTSIKIDKKTRDQIYQAKHRADIKKK